MKLWFMMYLGLLQGLEFICCDMNHQGSRKHCECSTNYVQSSLDYVTHVESRGAAVVSTTPNSRPLSYILTNGARQDGYTHSLGGHAVSPSGSEEALLKHTLRQQQQHDDPRRKHSDVMFMATRKSTSYLYHTPEGTQIDLQGQL